MAVTKYKSWIIHDGGTRSIKSIQNNVGDISDESPN